MKEKRIRMITFHTPKNYGAVLQAYSLMTFLKQYSPDVKVIDFNTPHLRSIYPLNSKPARMKAVPHYLLNLLLTGQKKRKYAKFERFIARRFDLTRRYESLEELRADPPEADCYVTGSDQVFNPNRIAEEREAFCLNFGGEEIKRIAYAASFGVKAIPEEKRQETAAALAGFQSISVREKSGVSIVQALTNKEPVETLDPVFLEDKAFWSEAAVPRPVGSEPYMLYYRLMGGKESDEAARRASKKRELRLVVVTDGFLTWRADTVLRDVGPLELLDLYKNAEYVATDSFHGVAFSLVFEKQFLFTDHNPKLAERAVNLMERAGCAQCACLNGGTGDEHVDYTEVSATIGALVERSKQFIEEALA
ncbi:MAG: polysaccharide pyruvyl transferase family protein [Oscillospiraceae bacterium]|nr:polysaccharide pyruvyl transferase family protein [Oscillospiraceae bacterium]